ncbi:uncharacterized protein LOC115876126 [Sitophilus oryzae]|uniref:Uncharacterized protein LOC115876126 n=1 Tax=Sitophilus oryzae TaxID=7048 RepID=A0A6J2X9N9_SITOR|nr:uncharacterized protein LOC115876126 [Sitophilus oryzae]
MGSLPKPRVVPSRPFYYCGVDYAGPYLLKDGKTRNRVKIKAYVCIFICLSTRAVHAELVTDLSTEGFLNAFKRFVSRRGLCGHVFSDNATNFVGSNNELLKLCQVVRDSVNEKYPNYFSEHRITWHFIPPKSPHHGGTWESAVRSFKHHLKRVLGDNHLNFENFYTLLTQIEAILNSRPILPLTNDLSDLEALTPGHFLIGESLIAVPPSNDIDIPANRLRHFKHLQQLVQRFWSLWSKDYLNSLQQRSKWQTRQENVKEGILVLLKEDNEPPMRWPLGRIVSVHPGSDNLLVEQVSSIKYLVKDACDPKTEILAKIEQARRTFASMKTLFSSRDLSLELHILLRCYIFPVFIYGAESWTLNQTLGNRINAFEMYLYCRMLGISWMTESDQ